MPTNTRKSPARYTLTRRGRVVRDALLLLAIYGLCAGVGAGIGYQLFN